MVVKNLKLKSNIFNVTQISWFYPILWFADGGHHVGQKSQIWAQFPTWLKFLDFATFHDLQDQLVDKSLKLESNCKCDSNILNLQNLVFSRTVAEKNSNFSQFFVTLLKYLDFTRFYVLHNRGRQKSQIWAKFSMWLKFLNFAQFYGLQDHVGQKSKIWATFST